MVKKKPLKSEYAGALVIGELEIPCLVAEDGNRYLTQSGFIRAIGRAQPSQGVLKKTSAEMPFFLGTKALKPFINNHLTAPPKSTEITLPKGQSALGYRAELLPQVCKIYAEAYFDGKLSDAQEKIAMQCIVVLGALAEVGIIALIDEATGYQAYREKSALQSILDRYLNPDAREWSKRFKDEFWVALIKLKGYPSYMALHRPIFVSHWVNDIVYSRLAPGVLDELKEINPSIEKGGRKNKHHTHLTDEGLQKLESHLTIVTYLMVKAEDEASFMQELDISFPKVNKTIPMDF